MGSDEEMDYVEEMVLPDNTPARRSRTDTLLHPRVVSTANSRQRSILKPRRSFSLTPKTNAKQSSQFPKIPFTELCPLPVFLYDWWLDRVDPKGLAVGGFVCRGNLGVRTFLSAAIVKRHYTTTLETEDGITVTINGLINKSRTCSNGVPSEIDAISSVITIELEVCSHFLLGFPHYWEEFADENFPTRFSSMSSGLPSSLDEIPVTRVFEFIMSPRSDVENCSLGQKLFDDVIEKCGYSCVQDESAHKRKKKGGQFKMDTKVFTPSSIVTRSMSRVKNLVMEPSVGGEKTSKGRGKQSEGVGSESGSKESRETTFAQVMGNPYKSTLRRSSRNMNKKKETH
ncbi:hypothetical protein EZV62_027296 [Acer yangbiense]|uniref:SANTA domain-containing protein n=1 Tax=Acer yangbiense TaxID=1000413 RepID=A0A5C7GUK1_9ROSI|nr:hypothetical protein EZV62_027296 [Acer yangbiense]